MKKVFRNDGGVRKTMVRDAHAPNELYVKTETNDGPGLAQNQRIRNAGLLPQDSRNPMVDGDVIAFSFTFPTPMDYHLTKMKEPELFARMSEGGSVGTTAAERFAILYPQFITVTRRGDSRRL